MTVSLLRLHVPGVVLLAALCCLGAWVYVRVMRGRS